jgi:hypothetical protein
VLTGHLIGMAGATAAVLVDVTRSRSYDPALCATAGGHYCDQSLLPPALGWSLVAVGIAALLLVFVAIGLKFWRAQQVPEDAGSG